MNEIWTPSSAGRSVTEISHAFADHVDRLVAAQRSARGSFLPEMGQGSAASRHVSNQPSLRTSDDPAPVRDALGTLERLTFAIEDELRGLARVFRGDEPPWFAHIPLIRGAVELLSRLWWLSDPTVDGGEIVRRHWNERLYEVRFIAAQARAASAMPADAVAAAERSVKALRQVAAGWGHGHLFLTPEKLLDPTSSLVVAYEAAIVRLFQFYGWAMSTELEGERFAIQLWRSRAAGLVSEG